MSNSNLKDKYYNIDGEQLKYTAIAMRESRLKKAKELCDNNKNCTEFNKLGGQQKLNKYTEIIKKEQQIDYKIKDEKRKGGLENQFLEKHEKDRYNANPTQVGGVPLVTKGNTFDKIMSGKDIYNESVEKEINEIKYLIEYMNNNKKNKI
jgi:ligand-binding sensor protein